MSSVRPKSTNQVRAIYGEARRCGLDNDTLHELVADVCRGSRSRSSSGFVGGHADAQETPLQAVSAVSIATLSYAEAEAVIERLKGKSFVPRRTLQWRRAKANIKQVVQEGQLKLIADLASQRHWSAESLANFCKRQCGHHPPRTTEDANKVIEALKAMNKREGLWAA